MEAYAIGGNFLFDRDSELQEEIWQSTIISKESMTKPKVKKISFDTNAVEIIPGLQLKPASSSSCFSKKPPKIDKPVKPTPIEPSSPEIDFSSFKSVNPVTQLLYTRYRNARKRLNRIESHEEQLANNPDYKVNEDERKSISKKEEIASTVRELYIVLPQVAELSQKFSKEAEELKEAEALRHQQELENAVQAEKEKSRSLLSKTINLFAAILQETQQKPLELSPEEKGPLNLLSSKFLSQPFVAQNDLLSFLESYHNSEANLPEDFPISSEELESIVQKTLAFTPQPDIKAQDDSAFDLSQKESGILASLDFLKIPGSEFPSDEDFDSPKVNVEPWTVVPPGGIFFLNPSEIYPGEPRALFKSL